MKILKLTLVLCLTFTSTLGLDEWIPITESPDVTEEEPKWSEDCTADLEKVFLENEFIDLNDNLSSEGEKKAEEVLNERSCNLMTGSNVVFCKFSKKSVRKGCKNALKDFKKTVKNLDDEILGCGFSSSNGKGFALVCLKNTENPSMILQQTVTQMCESLINDLYDKENILKSTDLESQAVGTSYSALKAGNCYGSTANRCKVLTNIGSYLSVAQCYKLVDGIAPKYLKYVGCKFIQNQSHKGAITCIIKRP